MEIRGRKRTFARSIRLLAAGAGAISFAACAPAQTPDLSEWQLENSAPDGTKLLAHSSGAKIFVGRTRDGGKHLPEDIVSGIAKACPNLVQAPNQRASDGIGVIKSALEPNGLRCTLALRPDAGGGSFALMISTDRLHAINPTSTSYQFAINAGEGGGAKPAAQAAASPAAPSSNMPADLRRALASVPQANRPIAVAYRREATFVGDQLQQQMKPWLIFANGNASNCFEWDPRTTAPLPSNATSRCSVERWKKVGNSYQYLSDGQWDEGVEDYVAQPISAGVNVTGLWESWSGVSFASSGPGTVGYARVAITKVGFEPGGKYFDASKSMTWQFTDSTAQSGGSSGYYATDGYLIATSKNGQIAVSYVAVTAEAGKVEFIWLNGDQYGRAE